MSNNNSKNSHNKGNNNKNNNKGNNKKGKKPTASLRTRRGAAKGARRYQSSIVNKLASQHVVQVPVNKSIYNGLGGAQFSLKQKIQKFPKDSGPTLKVIPLGGLGEMGIGKNMMAIEYGDDIITIDMGMLFPGDDYPGINYMIPDIDYIEKNKRKVRGHVFTHGHLDHIGAAKHVIDKVPAPLYGSKFTLGLIEKQLSEVDLSITPKLNSMDPDKHEKVKLGVFTVEFIRVNHSIPDSCAILVRTPVGNIIHTGDWRFEDEPIDDKYFDKQRMKELGDEGVLLLMNESTNCEFFKKDSHSERDIKDSFAEIMKETKGRIVISAFSSQIHRLQSIIDAAAESGRKVAFNGYSMIQNAEIAIRLGYLKAPKNVIMRMEDIVKQQDNKIVVVSTGSQGEINAALARMAIGEHRHFKVRVGDTIVYSSNVIPGNDNSVTRTVDGLMREGSDVIQQSTRQLHGCGPLHLSGHGYREDHLELLKLVRPKFYLPIHGEYHMLERNAELAHKEFGMPKENVFVLDSGDVLEMQQDKALRTGRVNVGSIMIDNNGNEISEVVLRDRLMMSRQGIFIVVLTIDKSGHLLTSPDIITRGFIYIRNSEELMKKVRKDVKRLLEHANRNNTLDDLNQFKKELRDDITHLLFDYTKKSPIVIPVVNMVRPKRNKQR